MRELSLIIHDVRSIHNVASLFRTADGMGVARVYLTGYTPGPIDRFGRLVAAFTKVSLGAETSVPWEQGDIIETIATLHARAVQVVALEQAPGATSLSTYRPSEAVALVVGNEVDGLPPTVLNAVDSTVEIPMHGKKESLNVASAGAIALWHLASSSPHR